MEEKIKEIDESDKFKILDDIEEVKEVEIKTEDKNEKENNENSSDINDHPYEDSEQYIKLAAENMNELEEKQNLINIFKGLNKVLNEGENKPKSINEVYEMYLENELITKSHIKNK